MSKPLASLPPHTRAMHELHKAIHTALAAHAVAHKQSHQKLVLTPQQADDLLATQLYGNAAGFRTNPQRDRYWDRPIEITESTAGEMVAVDGTVTPLSH